MAKIFGIEEEEFNELPETVKNSLKAADASATATEARLLEIETRLKPKEEPPKNEPVVSQWNPPVSQMDEMNYDNRMDVILMNFKTDKNPTTSTCVNLFEDEIRENLKKSHPSLRAGREYVKTIIDLVAGRHLAEITQDIRSGGSKYNGLFVESGGGGSTHTPTPKTAAEQLTPEERAMADKIGVSYEIFLENRA